MNVNITQPVIGEGKKLWVAVKRDADNYQGLYRGDTRKHAWQNLLENRTIGLDEEEKVYEAQNLSSEYSLIEIGEVAQ